MITAWLDNDTIMIYSNGFYAYSENRSDLKNKSIMISGTKVKLIGESFGGARNCYVYDFDQNGKFQGIYNEYL